MSEEYSEEYREEYREEYSELMEDLYEFLIEFMGSVRQPSNAQYLTGPGHSAAAAPEPPASPSADPMIYLAELHCQYLPPWSYHTLSSCCQCT